MSVSAHHDVAGSHCCRLLQDDVRRRSVALDGASLHLLFFTMPHERPQLVRGDLPGRSTNSVSLPSSNAYTSFGITGGDWTMWRRMNLAPVSLARSQAVSHTRAVAAGEVEGNEDRFPGTGSILYSSRSRPVARILPECRRDSRK